MPRIQLVTAYEVVVPARPEATNSEEYGNFLSHEWDHLPICILEARIDDGLTGLGEVGRGHSLAQIESWLRQLPGLEVRGLSQAVLPESWRGAGVFEGAVEEIHPTPLWASPSPVNGALEMILLDWAGKRLECRAVDLLGGPVRDRVAVDYWCGRKTRDDLRRTVSTARELGFRGLKMKSRFGDPVVEQVRAIREAGGEDFSVTIDPMYQWFSPNESLPVLKSLEQFGGGVRIEDPFPDDRPEFWRRAREVVSVPLIWHARTLTSLRRGLQEHVADGFNVGGVAREFLAYAGAVGVAGYSCWRGSALELGIAQVCGLHAAAAAPSCTMPSDFQSAVIREHTLVTWDWPYRSGTITLPEASGLGVDLDREALRRYTRREATFD